MFFENLQSLGPLFVAAWAITVISSVLRPQRYVNSIFLMVALLVTLVFVSGFFGENSGYFLLWSYIALMLVFFLVPFFLFFNGIELIRREGVCLAHCLSIALGLFVGIGEIAAVVYILGAAGTTEYGFVNPCMMILSLSVLYFSLLVLSFVLYSVFMQVIPHKMDFDYVIIHGCGLADGERPTRLLSNRIDKAIEVYEKCEKKPVIIPSGGQGGDEKVSEAEAMRRYLVDHGIPDERIVLEDKSTTTGENVAFSKRIIDSRAGGKRTALVSSNYHVYRCLRIARAAGLKCTGIGANVALYYWPSALIREFIAIFLTKRFLFWAFLGYGLLVVPIIYAVIITA